MKKITSLTILYFSCYLAFAQTMVNMKADKLIVVLPGKAKTMHKASEIKILICPPLLTAALEKEMREYQSKGQEIPREKLEKTFSYTFYESTSNLGISYYVGILPFPKEMNEETCLWNMTTAFAKKFDSEFSEKDCSNQLEKEVFLDANNQKRDVRTCVCTKEDKLLTYKVFYFDDLLYFLAAFGNVVLKENSPELSELKEFYQSFMAKP